MTKRHSTLDQCERWLGQIARGRAAETILAEKTIPARSALLILPTVAWLAGPDTLVKSQRGLMPYQLMWWNGDPIQLVGIKPEQTYGWNMVGFGRRSQGTMKVNVQLGAPDVDLTDVDVPPAEITVRSLRKTEIKRILEDLVALGQEARFRLIESFDPPTADQRGGQITKEVRRAERRVAHEMDERRASGASAPGASIPAVLDPHELEILRDEIQLGYFAPTENVERVDPSKFPMRSDGSPNVPAPSITTSVRPGGARLERTITYTVETQLRPSKGTTSYVVVMTTETREERLGTPDRAINMYTDGRVRPPVDFIHYLKMAIRRDAEQAVRRSIDDPWAGPKIRHFASLYPELVGDEFIAAYNERHPRDPIGKDRARRALDPSVRYKTVVFDENVERSLGVA